MNQLEQIGALVLRLGDAIARRDALMEGPRFRPENVVRGHPVDLADRDVVALAGALRAAGCDLLADGEAVTTSMMAIVTRESESYAAKRGDVARVAGGGCEHGAGCDDENHC